MLRPVNLRTQFGARYVIHFEESRTAKERDPWLYTIPAQFGHFYPHGETEIGAAVNEGHPRLVSKLAKLPGVRILQDGDDGANLVFRPTHFDAVARVLKPIKRRKRLKRPL